LQHNILPQLILLQSLRINGNLLKNVVRWAVKDNIPLSVEGAGLIDCHLYEQKGRLILHVVNLTSAATWRQPLDELITIGPLKLRVKLSEGTYGKSIRLNVSDQKVTGKFSDGWVQFEIKSLSDHELVIISG